MNTTQRTTRKSVQLSLLTSSVLLLASCAATQTAIEHRNLETSTKLSNTIFLDPVSASQKTIFIAVKNTSEGSIDIARPLSLALSAQGYRVVNDPAKAHYLLQANIRKVGKLSHTASENALGGGYGSALAGAGTGAALGALSGNGTATLASGLAGGLVGLAADSFVKDINFTMITDVQISERVGSQASVREQFNSVLENGSASGIYQTSSKLSPYHRYRTRIVSNANKVNLSFTQAKPALEQDLVKTLAGIF
ncbi:complement resistance protein TraT [Legionella fairfieldensis]|uniref:complement resistance protein TraT n=1 Tax=Legionella fairfieldensis TaxID=45064 RepID=UPI00048DFBF7|nr:complement resistance protein TraT [Legionella fairfieldensis]